MKRLKPMKTLAACATILLMTAPLHAQTIATVNGKAIAQTELDQFVQLLLAQGAQDTPQLREQVKEELIQRHIAVQAAEKAGFATRDQVKQEIELARQSILVRALLSDYLTQQPITDAQVQSEYDRIKAAQGERQEYKVRHILVQDKEKAEELSQSIAAKKITFEAAAIRDSIDAGSGKNGGDLGWAPAGNYVPAFAQAVEALKKGEMSKAPVQSQFGWHIIQLDDARPLQFPPLEQVKPQIEERLRQQLLSQYQTSLREAAKVE